MGGVQHLTDVFRVLCAITILCGAIDAAPNLLSAMSVGAAYDFRGDFGFIGTGYAQVMDVSV